MIWQKQIILKPYPRGFHLITREIQNALENVPSNGLLHLFIQHTSAGLTINENADPDVLIDFECIFNRLVPENMPFLEHTIEGPDDMPAHIKTSMVDTSLLIPISNHRMQLGMWQGIYLCEFRNRGGSRKVFASLIS